MNWEKISKYVTREMNAEERLAFEAIMITHPEYQEAVKGALSDLDAVDQFHASETRYDTDEAWEKLEGRIEASSNPNRKPHWWMRYAAAVAVLLVIGFVSVWRYHPKVQTITMIA